MSSTPRRRPMRLPRRPRRPTNSTSSTNNNNNRLLCNKSVSGIHFVYSSERFSGNLLEILSSNSTYTYLIAYKKCDIYEEICTYHVHIHSYIVPPPFTPHSPIGVGRNIECYNDSDALLASFTYLHKIMHTFSSVLGAFFGPF